MRDTRRHKFTKFRVIHLEPAFADVSVSFAQFYWKKNDNFKFTILKTIYIL